MICNPALWKIISPDLGTSVARANETFSVTGNLFFLFAHLFFVQSGTQHLHGFFTVAKLGAFGLTNDNGTGWYMGQKNFCLYLVNVLSTCAPASGCFHLHITFP